MNYTSTRVVSQKALPIFVLLAMVGANAYAEGQLLTPDSVIGMIQTASAPAINKLASKAITWLAIFTTIQFMITNYGVLKSDGGLDSIIAKAVGSFVWMGVCIYIITNGPEFIAGAGGEVFNILGLSLPSPGSIVGSTLVVVAGLSVLAASLGLGSTTAGMLVVYVLLIILAIGMFFAFKIFMIQLELGLVVMLSPLSFSFLGMNALRDQGIAPFKALISLGYRIILTTLVLSAFTEVSGVVAKTLSDVTMPNVLKNGMGKTIETMISALGAYLFLAYVFYKSDSVAASLAGGHTSMGTADVASAAAAGAAAGAAIATAGAAAVATAGKGSQSMSDVLAQMAGRGSVNNASSMGGGGQSTELNAPPPMPSSGLGPDTSGRPPPMREGESPASSNIGPNMDYVLPKGSPTPTASGTRASIGATGSPGQQSNPGAPKRSVGSSLSELGRHVAQDKAPTHVSINTNNGH